MLGLPHTLVIYLHRAAVDMRKSFDGLFGLVKNEHALDVRQGGLFMFLNKRRNRVKLMYWDRDGIAIWQKRLERGCLQHPQPGGDAKYLVIDAEELQLLLAGIELSSVKRRQRYVVPALPAVPPTQKV